jgi:hypothetical protein
MPPQPLVELPPPVSEAAWSSDLVVQTLEVLPVFLAEDGARWLRPIHAESLRLGLPRDRLPGEVVVEALGRYGVTPLLVHSTSWRHEEGRVVLTYVAAVEPPALDPAGHLADELITRSELARGHAFGPPPTIGQSQVIEHALRHLSWLVKDDPLVGKTLADWRSFLEGYEPEPFRALG